MGLFDNKSDSSDSIWSALLPSLVSAGSSLIGDYAKGTRTDAQHTADLAAQAQQNELDRQNKLDAISLSAQLSGDAGYKKNLIKNQKASLLLDAYKNYLATNSDNFDKQSQAYQQLAKANVYGAK